MSYDNFVQPNPETLTYGRYLHVHDLLGLQQELSEPKEHDELLFIVIHQVYELWFKQILHELKHCQESLGRDDILPMTKALHRVTTIQKVLLQQVDILETMTPTEFNRFRKNLNPASGFQSYQFREFEFRLGMKNPAHLRFFAHDAAASAKLEVAMREPTLYDHFLRYLKRQGFAVPQDVLDRDVTQMPSSHPELVKLFTDIYQNPGHNYQLYMVLEALVDLDELLVLWRYRHVQMVRRMIGDLSGTGGSLGARYLQSTLNKNAFPDIWEVRNHLGQGTTPYGSR